MSLAGIALDVGRSQKVDDVVDIVTFVESPWGLNQRLFPVQRIILKAHYGNPLDDNPWGLDLNERIDPAHPAYQEIAELEGEDEGYYRLRVPLTNWRRENLVYLTEAQYLRKLFDEGRCNIPEVIPGEERRELILAVGRRSGKTFLAACVTAYEIYKLINLQAPQEYYGLPKTNQIGIVSVATDKDQAGLLYNEASGHFSQCAFFKPYTANNTMSYAKFQTPVDIDRFGRYSDDPSAKATLKVSFKSCVAKGLRGPGNIVVILDELAHFNDAGQSDAKEIYGAVKPSTAAFSPKDPKNPTKAIGPVEGRMISISSPLGRQGHFYTLAQQALKGGLAAESKLFIQAPSWEVNITLEAGFLEGEYASDPVAFFTEYGAQFLDATRGWIENPDDLLACVNPELIPQIKGPALRPHFIGIDLALVGDWTAIAIGHIEDGGLIVVDLVDRIRAGVGQYEHLERLEFEDVVQWVYDLSKRFYFTDGIFDQWAGIPFEQALSKKGLSQLKSVHHTKPLTSQMYQNFRDMMWAKRLVLYNHPVGPDGYCDYIRELLELQASYQSKYVMVVEAPNVDGKHDDQGDAIVRMVWQASQQLGNRKYISRGDHRGQTSNGQGMQKAYMKALRRAKYGGGTSTDRQQSLINRGSTRGKR